MEELVFNPRKMSVAMVEAELGKRPDLRIDQLKALLANEGSQVRPRKGVERLLDARLLALAEEAIEAASDDMVDEVAGAEVAGAEADESEDEGPFGVEGPEEVSDVQEAEAEDALPGGGTKGPDLLGILGEMTAEQLAEHGLCRMMGPDPDDPMAPEGYEEIALNTPVHYVQNDEEHEGYYVTPQSGALIRMRDGQDTVIFVPEDSFRVSPTDEKEGSD